MPTHLSTKNTRSYQTTGSLKHDCIAARFKKRTKSPIPLSVGVASMCTEHELQPKTTYDGLGYNDHYQRNLRIAPVEKVLPRHSQIVEMLLTTQRNFQRRRPVVKCGWLGRGVNLGGSGGTLPPEFGVGGRQCIMSPPDFDIFSVFSQK